MSADPSTAVKTLVMTAIRDDLNSGTLEIGTTGMGTVLATVSLAATCGTVAGAVLTFTMPQSDLSADASGTAAAAQIKNSGGTVRWTGLTVGTSSTDIVVNTTTFVIGGLFTISSATITHA